MKSLFEGTAVAQVTPFSKGQIDFDALGRLINRNITLGAQAIVILATTGEGTTVTKAERKEVVQFCKEIIGEKAKLIVGTGHNNFQSCLENTLQAKNLGADGALVVTPYYNKTTQAGIVRYYEELAKLKFPIIMYNVPARTGLCIDLATIKVILKTNPYIFGIKESTTDITRINKLCEICKDKIPVYSGEDALNFVFYCLGGSGAISVTANVYPDKVQAVFDSVKSGQIERARHQQALLSPVDEILFCETNPIPVKTYLSMQNLMQSDVRLPLVPLSEKNKKKMRQVIQSVQSLETPITTSRTFEKD